MRSIPIVRASARAQTLDTNDVVSVTGEPVGLSCDAPPLLIARIVSEARGCEPQSPAAREPILARAGRLFAEATLEGQTPRAYCAEGAATSGLPVSVFARALRHYASVLEGIGEAMQGQRPLGTRVFARAGLADVSKGAFWIPRGRVLGVVAPGNHPEAHVGWLQGLALGYNVVVKPSRRDPFTPLRLVQALLEAGLRPGELSFAAGDHRTGDALVEAADLAIVFGGAQAVRAHRGNPRVLVRGPGRSKIFVRERDLSPERIALIARSVAADGGTRCTNASALVVDGDHEAVARSLARVLAEMPSLPQADARADLAVVTRSEAEAVRAAFDAARDGAPDLGAEADPSSPIATISERSAVVRPAVVLAASSRDRGFATELPFPSVWVAPWRAEEGIAPLRDSLVLSLLSHDPALAEAALLDASIRKVLSGDLPTFYSDPAVPHDGALADFLFETKGFARHGATSHV